MNCSIAMKSSFRQAVVPWTVPWALRNIDPLFSVAAGEPQGPKRGKRSPAHHFSLVRARRPARGRQPPHAYCLDVYKRQSLFAGARPAPGTRSTATARLLFRCSGLQRQRMQFAAHLGLERVVHDLMLLHAGLAAKGLRQHGGGIVIAVAGEVADGHIGIGNARLDQSLDLARVHCHGNLSGSALGENSTPTLPNDA